MLEARLQQQFFDRADLVNQMAQGLAPLILAGSSALVGALTAGNKILTAGLGSARLDATRLTHGLLRGFERERPGLAALTLEGDDAASLGSDVRSLGQPGDVLVLVCLHEQGGAQSIIDAAHDKDMSVVALGLQGLEAPLPRLLETDVWLAAPAVRDGLVRELHVQIIHSLLDAVDVQLLGEQET